ncbi:MAG: hypothetical protein IJH64_13040 [Oscillospiraceae bacterium]|nr:hypothetical protein [Oscillospiraceae bacterium]MBR0450920.1 hypothetical protein [Oscillospiraceae bacterium]
MSKYSIGLDMGTTSVSVAVLNTATGKTVYTNTKNHGAFLPNEENYFREQDVDVMFQLAKTLLDDAMGRFFPIGSIGLTGQMHGILYVDETGNAVSPLYTWQDNRLLSEAPSGKTYAEEITEKTGYRISAGYGLGTHYVLMSQNEVPSNAVKMCTIMDYVSAHLASAVPIYIHPTNAASLGFYDVVNNCFDVEALSKLNIDLPILPVVVSNPVAVGTYKDIPVFQAIGDNQASVLYSLNGNMDACLVNIGTGSQISKIVSEPVTYDALELRPFFNGKYILAGSALCGGKAYAMLEDFFRSYVVEATGKDDSQYDVLNRLAKQALEAGGPIPNVRTTFSGTRVDGSETGSITGLTDTTYTPAGIVLGTLQGIVNEMYEMYLLMGMPSDSVVASGNAVRRNKVLQELIARTFDLPLTLLGEDEEAAGGAAMFTVLQGKAE